MKSAASLRTSRIYLGAVARTIIISVMMSIAILFFLNRRYEFGSSLIEPDWVLLMLVELVLLAILLSWYQLRTEGDNLSIRWFPFFTWRLPLEELEGVAVTTAKMAQYGLGLRLAGNGTLVFLYRSGKAVLLSFQKRRYLVALDDAEETNELLEHLTSSLTPK